MEPQLLSKLYSTPTYHTPPAVKNLCNELNYPNLHSQDFASRPENRTQRMQDCWECLAVNDEGHVAVATNKRSGNEWWGEFFGFEQYDELTIERCTYKRQCKVPITKMQYACNNILLIGRTDSKLQAWSTYSQVRNPDEPYCLFLVGEQVTHENPINNLTVFRTDKKRAITTCIEGKLNVWNLGAADVDVAYTIKVAHNSSICDIDTSYTENSLFATCGDDLMVKLWDLRNTQPARTLYKEEDALKITALAWAASSELYSDNLLYLGDYDGNVHTLDIREPGKFIHTEAYFTNASVSKICVNGPNLAVIGSNPACIKVTKAADQNLIYECLLDIHTRILDTVWYDEYTLLTVGYGGRKYQVHKI